MVEPGSGKNRKKVIELALWERDYGDEKAQELSKALLAKTGDEHFVIPDKPRFSDVEWYYASAFREVKVLSGGGPITMEHVYKYFMLFRVSDYPEDFLTVMRNINFEWHNIL